MQDSLKTSLPIVITLASMTVVFVVWPFFMVRALWKLNAESRQRKSVAGAGYFTGIGHTLRTFRDFAVEPEHRRERWRLVLLTALLFALILLRALVLPM